MYIPNPILEEIEKLIEKLNEEFPVKYFLTGVHTYQKLLEQTKDYARVVKTYQLGPNFKLFVFDINIKIFVSETMPFLQDTAFGISRELALGFLENGEYITETGRFTGWPPIDE